MKFPQPSFDSLQYFVQTQEKQCETSHIIYNISFPLQCRHPVIKFQRFPKSFVHTSLPACPFLSVPRLQILQCDVCFCAVMQISFIRWLLPRLETGLSCATEAHI